ncbi:MAG: histone deacetylase family protein [Candidatus Eiseniibacteriota bacterium]
MPRTALLADARFRQHENPRGHPERVARIETLLSLADEPGRADVLRVTPRAASVEELSAVHTPRHVERVAASAGRERTVFDADTTATALSYETARLAVGGVLEVIDAVVDRRAENGFAFVRPPGHHAESDRVMGFCLFNNVALGAAHLRRTHGVGRVLILDWDVHHGNGTQEIFYSDADVMFVSLHQYPLYPGTGAASERGEGPGEGATLNVPLSAGGGDAVYAEAMRALVVPALRRFAPEFVLVSAGFDAHRDDPLANMNVTEKGFADLARRVMDVAADCCDGRLVLTLEGGYALGALRSSAAAVLQELGVTAKEGP